MKYPIKVTAGFVSACCVLLFSSSGVQEAAAAHPAITFDSVLFTRHSINYGHVQSQMSASMTSGQGGMYLLTGLLSGNQQIHNVIANSVFQNGPREGQRLGSFTSGVVRSAELDYDGKRIVFAFSPKSGGYGSSRDCNYWRNNGYKMATADEGAVLNIYTVNLDGTDLRQVTIGNSDNLDPTWLPNGRIAFVSGRVGMNVRCQPSEWAGYIAQNVLFSVKADGSDLIQLSWHETNECTPCVDNQGRIVYTRWDYIDRDFSAAHHMWVCNADGTDPRGPSGNYYLGSGFGTYTGDGRYLRPWAEWGIRAIPGTNGKYLAVAGPHHGPQFGVPIMIDINISDDFKDGQVTLLRPPCHYYPNEVHCESNVSNECCYHSPWPLDERYTLISKATGNNLPAGLYRADERFNAINMALYVMGMDGTEEKISNCQGDRGGHFLRTQPVRIRPRPPITTVKTFQGERRNTAEHSRAVISIMNVYEADVPLPSDVVLGKKIKEVRVVQLLPKDPCPGGEDTPKLGYGNGNLARAPLGTAPVESDGSAYFEAPVERGIYFQLLDGDGVAVQSMRSLTYVHPGENLTCVGCHEDKWKAPNIPGMPLALKRPPSKLTPEPSGSVPFSFGNLVKPVFDKTCAPCHNQKAQDPRNFSYSALQGYAWFYVNAGGAEGGGGRSLPGKIGARASRMGKALLATHRDRITKEEMRRVTLWLDLQSQKFGSYSMRAEEQQAQEFGGAPVYSRHIDPNNLTGVENDRPVVPVATIKGDDWGRSGSQVISKISVQMKGMLLLIDSPGNRGQWRLVDIQGMQLKTGVLTKGRTAVGMDDLQLARGMYILQAVTPGLGAQAFKFVLTQK